MINTNISNKNSLSLAVKLIVFITAVAFIISEISQKDALSLCYETFSNVTNMKQRLNIFTLVLWLMLINWSLEALKWRFLIKKIEAISFLSAVKAVLTGVCVSFFTPNRIGEYGGRVFVLENNNRIKGILITIIGSFAQTIVTVIAGGIGLMAYLHTFFTGVPGSFVFFIWMLLLTGISFFLIYLYFNIRDFTTIFRKSIIKLKWDKYIRIFTEYSFRELLVVFVISVTRYFIFALQFYLLLVVFGIYLPFDITLAIIALIFFCVTIIPTIALTELGVRGSVALYFFHSITDLDAAVLASVTMLWVINLVIPALAGAVAVFRLKIFQNT